MNDQVGCLHFSANFDSGNLESVTLTDPLASATNEADSSILSSSSAIGVPESTRRRGPAGRLAATLKDQHYYLNISADCAGQGSFEIAHNRSWFYFGVTFVGDGSEQDASQSDSSSRGGTPVSVVATPASRRSSTSGIVPPPQRHKATFSIVNLLATNLIFEHDNRPVYCNDTMTGWERLPQPLIIQFHDKAGNLVSPPPPSLLQQVHAELSGGAAATDHTSKKFLKGWNTCSQRITWSYTFTSVGETVHFAMCFPFSYHRQSQLIEEWRKLFGDDRGKAWLYNGPKHNASSFVVTSPVTSGASFASVPSESTSHEKNVQRHRTPPPPAPAKVSASAPPTPAKPDSSPRMKHTSSNAHQRSVRRDHDPTSPTSPQHDANQQLVSTDPSEGVYFHRETLCFSIQQRRVDLLTISGHNGKHPDGLREPFINNVHPIRSDEPRPFVFPDKKIVLITCRVHPAETPASHVLHGLIEFLLSNKDPRSVVLRQLFVFKIVPILNPDGVACGHYRTDTRGVNLNRMYDTPDPRFHPTIFAARELFLNLEGTKRLALYVDLHAHASKRGCFVFGNAWEDDTTQVQALLYPKLLSMNSAHFDFPSCDFTSRSMRSGNKSDGTTKGGTGRVALAASGGLVECYTLEASYCMGLSLNPIVSLDLDRVHLVDMSKSVRESSNSTAPATTTGGGAGRRSSRSHSLDSRRSSSLSGAASSLRYSPETYHELGRGILTALLDHQECNPASRLSATSLHSVDGVRSWLERQLRQLHSEQMRMDGGGGGGAGGDKKLRKNALEHNLAMERLGAALHLPAMNAYNNASQHKLTRSESGVTMTVKSMKEQRDSSDATAPLRLLA
ncbi:zinc carboxypeptidase, putative [Bodo saltans]|uniref:tubulin-glutamate carboxypeptidase n=1 Tax=Bodo saltans TaxID=75058 RepID=A0A0S4KII7_BODSA|nr:zinc carboxypeptidase, putative [Bodo saltans]|eukprot:CUI15446.1 zinc carboxypeptidase, putative [Bodo saltans]